MPLMLNILHQGSHILAILNDMHAKQPNSFIDSSLTCIDNPITSTSRPMLLIKWNYTNENEVMCSRGARDWEYRIGAKYNWSRVQELGTRMRDRWCAVCGDRVKGQWHAVQELGSQCIEMGIHEIGCDGQNRK